uniref:MSP domain-containing protein n=1 Tax=Ditylenchus dipsaci TaxID=166011 RepID=A0A915CZU4_9BILA
MLLSSSVFLTFQSEVIEDATAVVSVTNTTTKFQILKLFQHPYLLVVQPAVQVPQSTEVHFIRNPFAKEKVPTDDLYSFEFLHVSTQSEVSEIVLDE